MRLIRVASILCLFFILIGCNELSRSAQQLDKQHLLTVDGGLTVFILLSILGAAASITIIIWGGVASKWGWVGLTFWALVIAASTTYKVIESIMPWLVGGGLTIGAGILIWYLYKHSNIFKDLALTSNVNLVKDSTKKMIDYVKSKSNPKS